MPNTDERFSDVSAYAINLADIAKNIQIIQLQDSLLSISGLSTEEKRELALSIKKEKDEKKRKALENSIANNKSSQQPSKFGVSGANASRAIGGSRDVGGPRSGSSAIVFPLYNEKARKKGEKDFEKSTEHSTAALLALLSMLRRILSHVSIRTWLVELPAFPPCWFFFQCPLVSLSV